VTESGVEVFRRMFAAYAEGGVEPALRWVDEDAVIEIPPELSAEPDDYHGHDGARRYFAGFDGMLEDVRFEALDVSPVGDRVLAHMRVSGRGASSGLEVTLESFVLTAFAGDKIVRIRAYASRDAAERAIAGAD
jgi:ketosteroid isomerase-like protein